MPQMALVLLWSMPKLVVFYLKIIINWIIIIKKQIIYFLF